MVKADLGTKRACLACGMRFYDFSRSPIVCPGCGAEFDPENIIKSRKGRPAAKTMPRDDVRTTDDDEIEGDDVNDFHRHENAFAEWIPQFIKQGEKIDLNIYVTGLTQLLTSVLASIMNMDSAHRQTISLTLWHFDRERVHLALLVHPVDLQRVVVVV